MPTSAMVAPRNTVNPAGVFEAVFPRASQAQSRSTSSGRFERGTLGLPDVCSAAGPPSEFF